ncbi:MAG: hypothetical protein KC464_13620 [Myxococcales bacterium]|nr:hypothetical protein [Myxococcales bacterium]
MLSIVVAACGGDDGFTDAAPGPDAPVADAAAADAEMIDGTPDADVTPPETTITAQPAALASSATATFEFTADEAATFECDLDGGGFAACTSPASFPDLVDGAHHFEVRATDGAGNVDATPAAYDWSIDTVAPETTIDQAPPLVDNSRDVSFAFSADEDGTFECDLDGAGFAACTSPQAYVDLVDATHTFTVRAIDLAGNVDPTPAVHTWVLDATTPDTQIDSGPADPTNQVDATFTFSSPNVGAGAIFDCDLDGAGFAACTSPVTYTGLAEGAHTFTVRVTDEAANSDPTPATATWTIDLTAPETTLDTAPVDPSPSATATFTFSADEVGATFACDLDGAGFTACTSPATYPGLADGPHAFAVRAIDAAGNVDGSPASHAWTVDTVAPETTISSQPADPTNLVVATFTFFSDEATATFGCSLDGAAFVACASPTTFPALAAGAHTVMVRATDAAGNVDLTPASRSWTIDLTPPDTTITASPPSPTASTSASFTFTATEAGSTFACRLDGAAFAPCATPLDLTGLAGGSHSFEVRATDPAGNADPSPAQRVWTIDQVAPDTTILSAPDNPTIATDATFTFGSTEAGSTFECRLDGAPFAACVSPTTFNGLGGGSHTFQVRATDQVGNVDATPASRTWQIDGAAPDTSITTRPADPTNQTSALFGFQATESGSSFACQLDGGGFAACTAPKAYAGLAAGSHTFEVQATDSVGNTDPSPASYTWTIDTTAPDTSITAAPASPTNASTASFSFTATEAGSTFACRLDGSAFEACASPRVYAGVAAGSHTFEVRAIDPAGNVDASPASHTWTVDTTAPNTTITSAPASPTSATTASFAFTATEAGSTFACQVDGGGFAACVSPQAYAGLAEGSHTFVVRATDPAGNTDATPATATWTIDTTAPNTTITSAPASPTAATTASFSFTATEAGSTFACQLDGGGFAACTSPQAYVGVAEGSHTFAVRATDPSGNTDATPAIATWTIDTTAPDTTIASGPADPTNQVAAAFTFTATEVGSSFQCRIDGGGFTACASPKSYAALSAASHTFEVRALDPSGNTDATPASYTWTIDVTAPDTSITSSPATPTNQTGASFAFTSTEVGSTFACQLDGGGYAACTSPEAYAGLSEGAHTFAVRATDPAGNTDATPASRTWTIDTTAPTTAIDSGPSGTVATTDAAFTFSSDDGAATFACQLDGGGYAACASPASYTGLAQGAHTFEVRATDAAGNTDATPASRTWTIDTGAPDTSITAHPADPTNQTGASFTFTATEPGTFECDLDGGGYAACTTPKAYAGLAAGSHTFSVRAIDGAANVDPTPATFTWTIDTTAPDTTITGQPPLLTSSGAASFTFSATETSTFACDLDGGGFAACTSPESYAGLADGSHTFQVRATDGAGNVDATPATYTWTVDSVAPDVTIDVGPPALDSSADPSFEFSSTDGSATFECDLDGGGFAACLSPHAYTGLAEGAHTFSVRAVDGAGNVGVEATLAWTIDTVAPDTTITGNPTDPETTGDASFTFTSDDVAATFECQLDGGGYAACASPQPYTGLLDGSHTFDVRAVDAAGNVDASPATYTWTVAIAAAAPPPWLVWYAAATHGFRTPLR